MITSLSFLRPTTKSPSRWLTLSLSARLTDNDESGGDILGAGELKVADLEPGPAPSFGRIRIGGPSCILRGAVLARAGVMEDIRSCFAFLLMVEEDEGRFLLEGRCSLAFCFALKKGSVVK